MLNKSELMKKWNEMSTEDKQLMGVMAGVSASLFLRGLLNMKRSKQEDMEVIKILVKKDSDVMIFVKGGK